MSARILTTDELVSLIDQGQPIPEHLRAIVSKVIRDTPALESTLTAQRYIDLGKGKHTEPNGTYTLTGEDLHRSPSTIRDHYDKYKHLLDPTDPEYSE